MDKISKELKKLESILLEKGSPLLSILGAGLTELSITNKFNELGLSMPQSFLGLYKWKNGIDPDEEGDLPEVDPQLFTLGILDSLDRNTKCYQFYVSENYWDKMFFPIFNAWNSEFFMINCDSGSSDFGVIFYLSFTDHIALSPITAFDSLETLFSGIIECYERGIYSYETSSNMFAVSNTKQEIDIHIKHNPNSLYWKKVREEE